MDLNQIVESVKLSKVCSIKADKESNESKNITLEVTFDDVPLMAVFQKAISQTVIQWQNGPGRSKFSTWKDNQVVKVAFKAPAITQIDPEAAMDSKFASWSREKQLAYIKKLEKAASGIDRALVDAEEVDAAIMDTE